MNIIQMLIILLKFIILDARYSLYYSKDQQGDSSIFDCLYAYHLKSDINQTLPRTYNYHLIPFCRQFDENEKQENLSFISYENVNNIITFTDLYREGITSIQLLDWSSSIDVAERYEENGANSDEIFYNCSSLWFGSRCQYKLDYNILPTFGHVIKNSFDSRDLSTPMSDIIVGTCYSFLTSCYRGPSPMCLDWREICDGSFDCLNGEDEQFCEILEISQCSDNEFRCHYSGECIPLIFLHDGRFRTDCLDSTDEMGGFNQGVYYKTHCHTSPSFDCEESKNRRPLSFSCGDGEINFFLIPNFVRNCHNRRDYQMTQALFNSFDSISNIACREVLSCLLRINESFIDVFLPKDRNCEPLINHCSSDWVVFPEHPIMFGFFQFLYLTNRSVADFKNNFRPDFICFNASRCPAFIFCIKDIGMKNGLNCCRFTDLSNKPVYNWNNLHNMFGDFIDRCSKIGTDEICSHPSYFHCPLSHKCIPTHRLVDSFEDCYYKEDELFPACQLNDSQRYKCRLDPNICLAVVGINDRDRNCPTGDDEMNVYVAHVSTDKISFGRFCDGFCDTIWVNMSGETDESHCEWWPCNNANVRCDGYWQCVHGFDELSCPQSQCSFNEHICTHPSKQTRV